MSHSAEALFDTCLDSVLIVNSKGEIQYANDVAASLLESTPRKLIRTKPVLHDLIQFHPPVPELKALSEIQESVPYREIEFQTESGGEGRVQISIQPMVCTQEKENKWLIYLRDVSLEQRLQKKYHAELDAKQEIITQLEVAKGELEKYSHELELRVLERTQQLSDINQQMKALLDSLAQGFFIFDEAGYCLKISSLACERILGRTPNGQPITEVLGLNTQREVENFQKWKKTLFLQMLPFEDLVCLGPQKFNHPLGREIRLEYYPLIEENGKLKGVVTVATDITELVEAERVAKKESAKVRMILNIVQDRRSAQMFVRNTKEFFSLLFEETQKDLPSFQEIFRLLHTIKGGAALFSIHDLVTKAHEAENLVNKFNQRACPYDSVQRTALIQLVQQAQESFTQFLNEITLIFGPQLIEFESLIELKKNEFSNILRRASQQQTAQLACRFLYNHILLEPISNFFSVYSRLIQKSGEEHGKELLPLQIENGDTLIFPSPYLNVFGSLVHAFRNAIDHGIESAENRTGSGKPAKGLISVKFSAQNGRLTIRIQDDGRGIDPNSIRQKLLQKGIDTSRESDSEVIQHIFDPYFSTKELVTETSGRGVGVDAIRNEAERIGGIAYVQSTVGQGTTLIIDLPHYESDPDQAPNSSMPPTQQNTAA